VLPSKLITLFFALTILPSESFYPEFPKVY
jgi:hypothetical protein